jgi:hypothetical protein
MKYLGNIPSGQTLYFAFASNNGDGAAVAPTVDGAVSVYKDDGTGESTAGVTYTPSFDGIAGVNLVKIVTTDGFYAAGHDYSVVLAGATIDGQTVNAVLACFSIDHRLPTNDIDGKTLEEAVRYMAAVLAGKISGAGSGTETFLGLDGATPRVQVAADAAGNRSAITYDPT